MAMAIVLPITVTIPSDGARHDILMYRLRPERRMHNTKGANHASGFRTKEGSQGSNCSSSSMGADRKTLFRDGRLKDFLHAVNNPRIQIDSNTYASLLQACANLKSLAQGKLVHAHMVKTGFEINDFIGSKLVIMYVKCESLVDGRLVFDRLQKRNMFSWTAIIGGYAKHGHCEEALKLYYEMQHAGMQPDHFIFPSVLKACAGLGSLQCGRDIHDCIIRFGYEKELFVGNALVDMYAKCGSLENARHVFDKMSQRDVVSWNAMIASYVRNGQGDEAVELFHQMQLAGEKPNVISWNAMISGFAKNGYDHEALKLFTQMQMIGVKSDLVTLVSVLSACSSLAALQQGKEIHTYIMRRGFETDAFVGCALVDMYAKCQSIENARQVFDKTLEKSAALWNAMIAGYAQNGYFEKAFELFNEMQLAGVKPDVVTWNGMIAGYAHNGNAYEALKLLHQMQQTGVVPDVFSWNLTIACYAQIGDGEKARELLSQMEVAGVKPDVISWNAIISGCAQNGRGIDALDFFRQMQLEDLKPTSVTIAGVLSACASLEALHLGKEIHHFVIKNAVELDVFVGSALIDMYAKCESMEDACIMFDKMSQKNVVSWNAMIAGYVQNRDNDEALNVLHEMQQAGVKPNSFTITSVLCACANLAALQQGKEIHAYIIRNWFELDAFVGSALVNMYSKCINIENARQVFDMLSSSDVASWNAMIAGYAQNGHAEEAYKLFSEMQLAGVKPDVVTWNGMIGGYAQNGQVDEALKLLHQMQLAGIEPDMVSWNLMITGYAQNGHGDEALQLFSQMELSGIKPNMISWNAVISGYAQNGQNDQALKLFRKMQLAGTKPNSITISGVLPSCANLAALQKGKEIHGYIIRSGLGSDVYVGSALLDMYAKCGSIEEAEQVFAGMFQRDVVLWNAMIAGFAMHGYSKDSLTLFNQMQEAGMKPDHSTFTGVLSACSHAGLVDEGWQYFDRISQHYGMTPSALHYACMVNLLGRAGHLNEAQDFINMMPSEPDACVWGALLGACKIHCNIELGECVAKHLFELEPNNAGNYVLLSNIYATAGRWDDVARVRKMMKDRGLKKMPGCSWIEVKNMVHVFTVGDRSHPKTEKIYAMLESLAEQMKEAGYVPDTNFVLQDVVEEKKEHILCGHSEKLAIAFGIMNTGVGIPVRVIKNIRMCGDCHTATKFISKIVGREIVVRDANRFHHFKDGLCSCMDYW